MRPILLTLMLVLLLTGSGEAGEMTCPANTNVVCWYDERGEVVAIVDPDKPERHKWMPTCYQRMQEAMREMDERLEHFNGLTEGCPRDHYCEKIEQRFVEGTKLSRLWREVVNNCVKETP